MYIKVKTTYSLTYIVSFECLLRVYSIPCCARMWMVLSWLASGSIVSCYKIAYFLNISWKQYAPSFSEEGYDRILSMPDHVGLSHCHQLVLMPCCSIMEQEMVKAICLRLIPCYKIYSKDILGRIVLMLYVQVRFVLLISW